MKRLLLLTVLCFSTIKAEINKIVTITNCSKFLNDSSQCVDLLKKSARKAKIHQFYLTRSTSHYEGDYYYFVTESGFISLLIDVQENKCSIEFYCSDDSFDYNKFISHFLKTCYKVEHPHIPTVIFANDKSEGYEIIEADDDFITKLMNNDMSRLECM